MRNKWKILFVLCIIVSLFTACSSNSTDTSVEESSDNSYKTSEECVVYIEFDESYSPEKDIVSLTPASKKNASSEIPVYYYPNIKGSILTLDEGAYCIRMITDSETHERYFIVDNEHSYYHIRFTSEVYS